VPRVRPFALKKEQFLDRTVRRRRAHELTQLAYRRLGRWLQERHDEDVSVAHCCAEARKQKKAAIIGILVEMETRETQTTLRQAQGERVRNCTRCVFSRTCWVL